MKQLVVEVEEDGQILQTVTVEGADADALASNVSEQLNIDLDEIMEGYANEIGSDAGKDSGKGHKIRIRRVCVELHFESHNQRHNFLSKSKWSRVHRWGCRKFTIAQDACANLELHENTPDGAVLNENKQIGSFKGCKPVWLVKPGPEQNGQ